MLLLSLCAVISRVKSRVYIRFYLGIIGLSTLQKSSGCQFTPHIHLTLTISQKQKKFHFEVLAQRLKPALSRVVPCTKVTTQILSQAFHLIFSYYHIIKFDHHCYSPIITNKWILGAIKCDGFRFIMMSYFFIFGWNNIRVLEHFELTAV